MSQPLPAIRYLLYLTVTSIVLAAPYAVPALWTNLTRDVAVPAFLHNPVESQRWYILLGSTWLLLPAAMCYRPGNVVPIPVMVTVWFCYTLVRALLLQAPDRPVSFILIHCAFLVTFLAAITSRPSTTALNRFRILLIAATVPLCCVAISQRFGSSPLGYQQIIPGTSELANGKLLVASTFGHPNYMSSYLAPVFVLAAGLFNIRSKSHAVVGVIGSVTIITTILLAGTRGSLLALLVGTGISLILANRSRKTLIYGSAVIIAIAIAGIIALAAEGRLMASKEIAARAFYWDMGLQMFRQNPIIGIGPNQFDAMFWHQIAQDPETGPGRSWHFALTSVIRGVRPEFMHNDHLQVLVETGLVGAFLWIAVWAMITGHAFSIAKSPSHTTRTLNASMYGAIIAIAVDACFNFPFHLPCSGVLFWILLGLWVGWDAVNKIPPKPVKG